MVASSAISIEVSLTLNIGNINLINKVLESSVDLGSWHSFDIVDGVFSRTVPKDMKILIFVHIDIIDMDVNEVLELLKVGSGCSDGWGIGVESISEVLEIHTSHVEVKTGRWTRSTGLSTEFNTACTDGSTDADRATTG